MSNWTYLGMSLEIFQNLLTVFAPTIRHLMPYFKPSLRIFSYRAARGDPQVFLPILHSLFLESSPILAHYLASRSFNLTAQKDSKFLETIYKILRDEFNYRPSLTQPQFFSIGFAERKIIFTLDIIELCTNLTKNLLREQKRYGGSGPEPVISEEIASPPPLPLDDPEEMSLLLYEPSYIQHEWKDEVPRPPSPIIKDSLPSLAPVELEEEPEREYIQAQPNNVEEIQVEEEYSFEEPIMTLEPKETVADPLPSAFEEECLMTMNRILERQDAMCSV